MDRAAASALHKLQHRSRTRPVRRARPYRPGANAVRYMTLGALVTETYRQYVEGGGSLSQLSSGLLGGEFARRGLEVASGVVTGLPPQLADLAKEPWLDKLTAQIDNPSVSDAVLENQITADVDELAQRSGFIDEMAGQPGQITQAEFLEDLSAQGVPQEVADAFAFTSQFSPDDLTQAVASQQQAETPQASAELVGQSQVENVDAAEL